MEGVTSDLTEFQTSFLLLVYQKPIQPEEKEQVIVSISLYKLKILRICIYMYSNLRTPFSNYSVPFHFAVRFTCW